MTAQLSRFLTFITLLLSASLAAFAQDSKECVIVIQGVRAYKTPPDPLESFIKNSADAFIKGMGLFPGPPTITVLRPAGEPNDLGGQPPRTEQSYSSKAQILAQIKAALCKAECRNVVLAFVGHGMGGLGIMQPPSDKNDGGLMVKSGAGGNEFITAGEMADIIDECKKSVKLFAASCYSEAMVNGILDSLHNDHLVGVGVSSSGWNEKSIAHGPDAGTIIYDFMLYFMQDYYLILGNPNLMDELKAKAAELQKANDVINEGIKAENAAMIEKIKACEKELDGLKKDLAKAEKDAAALKPKADNAQKIIDLLNARKPLLEDLKKANTKAEKEAAKAALKTNEAALKKLGLNNAPNDVASIDTAIKKQQAIIDEYKALTEKIKGLKNQITDKEFALEKLQLTPPKAPIPNHQGLMELVIHEAWKSASAKTPAESGIPKEPDKPSVVSNPESPSQPLTKLKIGNYYFHLYKVINKKNNKCTVVGFWANALGTPIQLLKSYDCDITCKNAKFSITENGQEKIFEAIQQADGSYIFKKDGQDIAGTPQLQTFHLICPGVFSVPVQIRIGFKTISGVYVPGYLVQNISYDANTQTLSFDIEKNGVTTHVVIKFLPHGNVQIQIANKPTYLESQVRAYTLFFGLKLPYARIATIVSNNQLEGTSNTAHSIDPIYMQGTFSSDGTRMMLQSSNVTPPLVVQPLGGTFSLMQWSQGTQTGILQPDWLTKPDLLNVSLNVLNDGRVALAWQYDASFLNDYDANQWLGTRIIKLNQFNQVMQVFDVPKSNNTFVDPDNSGNPNVYYQVQSNSKSAAYCVPYESPFFDEYGIPLTVSLSNNARLATSNGEPVLLQNIPNPFDNTTRISFILPQKEEISLQFFSQSGRLVKQISGTYESGYNEVIIKQNELGEAGLYVYQLHTAKQVITKKMVLVR